MNQVRHPNIIHMHEYLESVNNYYMILDYCNQGDLESFMKQKGLLHLEEKTALFILKQIMNGFTELRKYSVIH